MFGLFKKKLLVLRGTITATDENNYYVNFEKLHQQTAPIEYVRFVMALTTKLCSIEKSRPQSTAFIQTYLRYLLEEDNLNSETLNRHKPTNLNIHIGAAKGKQVIGTLAVINTAVRQIHTKIPLRYYNDQMGYSIIASIHSATELLPLEFHKYLKAGLEYIHNSGKIPNMSVKDGVNFHNEAFLNKRITI